MLSVRYRFSPVRTSPCRDPGFTEDTGSVVGVDVAFAVGPAAQLGVISANVLVSVATHSLLPLALAAIPTAFCSPVTLVVDMVSAFVPPGVIFTITLGDP